MPALNKKNIYILIFFIWVIFVFNFILRDLFYKKYLQYYKVLLSRNSCGKRSYMYGDHLFEYLNFCKVNLPEHAEYEIIGIGSSIDDKRAVYYLYPHLRSSQADYLLVFDSPDYKQDGYEIFTALDKRRFILKRKYK